MAYVVAVTEEAADANPAVAGNPLRAIRTHAVPEARLSRKGNKGARCGDDTHPVGGGSGGGGGGEADARLHQRGV